MLRRRNGERRRWAAGESSSGPVWPPADGPTEQVMPVRVTREIHEVIETVGTPSQIARSGLTAPGGGGEGVAHNEGSTAGRELPAATGGLLMNAFSILAAFESWLVWLLHTVLLAGARHPRVVLWAGALLWIGSVTS